MADRRSVFWKLPCRAKDSLTESGTPSRGSLSSSTSSPPVSSSISLSTWAASWRAAANLDKWREIQFLNSLLKRLDSKIMHHSGNYGYGSIQVLKVSERENSSAKTLYKSIFLFYDKFHVSVQFMFQFA